LSIFSSSNDQQTSQPEKNELRLVICDSETGKPAAELDVWNTEIALARLKVTEIE